MINLGAIVTRTNGIATHITHIKGTIKMSFSTNLKLSTKKRANIATKSLPITAEGTISTSFEYLAKFAHTANPKAVMKPKISPRKFPNLIESKNINVTAEKVISIAIQVFLSVFSFKNMLAIKV